jgi:hypothetical protein
MLQEVLNAVAVETCLKFPAVVQKNALYAETFAQWIIAI